MPLLISRIKTKFSQIPEFDNLYLDMNGIIHNCSHPNDDDVSFRISEEQIMQDIFAYIEVLFILLFFILTFYIFYTRSRKKHCVHLRFKAAIVKFQKNSVFVS